MTLNLSIANLFIYNEYYIIAFANLVSYKLQDYESSVECNKVVGAF